MIGELPDRWNSCTPTNPVSPNPNLDLSFCDQWPHNDHPLVYRLCRKCRGVSDTSLPPYPIFASESALRSTIEQHGNYYCLGSTLNGSDCKTRVAEIFGWLWSNGGEIGRRTVGTFVSALNNASPIPVISFENIGNPAKAGPKGFGILGLSRGITIKSEFETGSIDHTLATYIVHEVEHFWNDSDYSGTTMGGVRAYLTGYLYLLERGFTNSVITGITGINEPTGQAGVIYCDKGIQPTDGTADQWSLFSRRFFEFARGTFGGSYHSDESRLPEF